MTCHRCGHSREEHNSFLASCSGEGVVVANNKPAWACPCRAFQEPPNPDQTTLFEEGK